MSPARRHRDKFAASTANGPVSSAPVDPAEEGGQDTPTPVVFIDENLTPALRHRLRTAGIEAATIAAATDTLAHDDEHQSTDRIMALRLVEDLRRLADTKSREKKIEAKRDILPAYADYVAGLLAGAREGALPKGDLLPTVMIWLIDVEDYERALPLIEAVLEHDLPLPSKYERDAPTFIVEQIAEAAIAHQAKGERFDLHLLEHIEELTAEIDMHDQVRAKLERAIGEELFAQADGLAPDADGRVDAYRQALKKLERARDHDVRIGVKEKIKRIEKTLAVLDPPQESDAGTAG